MDRPDWKIADRRLADFDRRVATRDGRRKIDHCAYEHALAAVSDGTHHPIVLIVDDYQDGREMTAEYLRDLGFRVYEAGTGNEAIEKTVTMSPDIVLLDLRLPDIDGIDVAMRLTEIHCPLKIVALTGVVTEDARKQVAAAGITTRC